jgi:hypothetical protein
MGASDEGPVSRSVDRVVLLGAAHGIVIEDLKEITLGSSFLYAKEHQLQNVLLEAFAEMAFVVHQFEKAHESLLATGTPELDTYVRQLNEAEWQGSTNLVVELHAFDLSTYFKSFLLLAKAVLDKVVPLFSYRFYDNLDTFKDRGDRLIGNVKKNGHVLRKTEFIALIERAKTEWLDALVALRDEYAHYSNLKEYVNFWAPGDWIGKRRLTGIQDFCRPSVEVAGEKVDALEYILSVKAHLVHFLREFLQLCEFTPDRRPRHYLSCEGCGYAFAKRAKSGDKKGRLSLTSPGIAIEIKDRAKDYGVIICPRCGGKTDTDLQFWKAEGLSFSSSPPSSTGTGAEGGS